jgi:hypothetical protein
MKVIEQMMRNGINGTEISAKGFVEVREKYALPYVIASFVVLSLVSLMAFTPLMSLFTALLVIAVWLLVAYSYIAIGTQLAHVAVVVIGFVGFIILGLQARDYFSLVKVLSGLPGGSMFAIRMVFYSLFAVLFLAIGVLTLIGWRKQTYVRQV